MGIRLKVKGERLKGRRIGFVLLFFFSFFLLPFTFHLASAQIEDAVKVSSRVLPTKAHLGDELRLLIQVSSPDGYSVTPPSDKNKLTPFEIKRVEARPAIKNNGYRIDTFVLTLTVFELGDLTVPPVSIIYADGAGRTGQAFSKAAKVKVNGVKKRSTDKEDIRPIKGPVSIDLRHWRDALFGVLALLLAVWLGIKIVLRRRSQQLRDLESLKPPHERAALELGRLQNGGWLEQGKVKEYYSELADILRRYLNRCFGFQTMDLTTLELLKELKQRGFYQDVIEKVRSVLENSDLVKFAKLVPARTLASTLVIEIQRVVELTMPAEDKKEVVG